MTSIPGRCSMRHLQRGSTLILLFVGMTLADGAQLMGQDLRAEMLAQQVSAEELRELALPALLTIARHVLSADQMAGTVDPSTLEDRWRRAVQIFEGREGTVVVSVSRYWPQTLGLYVEDADRLLPTLTAQVADQLQREGYPVRAGSRHLMRSPGPVAWSEWRSPEGSMLMACPVQPGRYTGRIHHCAAYEDVEVVLSIGHPVPYGPFIDAPVFLVRPDEAEWSRERPTETGFRVRLVEMDGEWVVSALLPMLNLR